MTPTELKHYRGERTQRELAGIMGVNASQICRWEGGKNKIPEWVDKFVKCLGDDPKKETDHGKKE